MDEKEIKRCISVFLSLIFFTGQAVAQIKKIRCSYNEKLETNQHFVAQLAPWDVFPWGVCLKKANTSYTEDKWIKEAMWIWNT